MATLDVPSVPEEQRVRIEMMTEGFQRITAQFGFMETPRIEPVLKQCRELGLKLHLLECTFFLSRETIVVTARKGMAIWRERLFALLSRNAQPATAYFGLPVNRVVELGMQVEI
jgi:KUP system potassium uptake protein